jgi:hypothetical protein
MTRALAVVPHAALVRFCWKKYGPFGKFVLSDNLSQRPKDLSLRQAYITVRLLRHDDENEISLAELCAYIDAASWNASR